MIKKIFILSILMTGLFLNLLPVLVRAQSGAETGAGTANVDKGVGTNDFNTPATGLDPIDTTGFSNQGKNDLPSNQNSNTTSQNTTSTSGDTKVQGILVLPDPLNLNADISKAPGQLVTRIINIFLGLIGIGALIVIIYGGALYLFSMGDPKKADKGRKVLGYAIIGLAIILGAYIIINTALSILTQVTK